MPDNPTCATCRFWVEFDDPGVSHREGTCNRRSPVCDPKGNEDGVWPVTFLSAWCGEHAPRVAEPRCWLHPDRITDGNLLFGRHLCGDCWMEWMVAEQDGTTQAFRAKVCKGPEAPVVGADFGAGDDRTVICVPTFAHYVSAAADHGATVDGPVSPGDSFTVGSVTWVFRPVESPDAPR